MGGIIDVMQNHKQLENQNTIIQNQQQQMYMQQQYMYQIQWLQTKVSELEKSQ